MTRKRWTRPRWIISGAAAASIAVVGGGWFAATAFQSPAQREAAAAPPTPGIVTATVERGDLVRTATLRLTVQRQARTDLPLPTQPDDLSIVTAQPVSAGATLNAGAVATEVNGRPVIALPGDFPYYRTLTVGDRGPDVDQLQRGLMAAGLLHGHDGVFGAPTESAVRKLYEQAHASTPVERTAGTDPDASDDAARPESAAAEHVVVRPADVLVVDELPATVVTAPAVGTVASAGATFTLERGDTQAVADISPTAAAGLAVDTIGTASVDNTPVKVRVAAIGNATGTEETQHVTITGAEVALPADLVGRELVATLDIRVAARAALIVPTSAVIPGGDKPAYVLVHRRNTLQRVAVEELGTLDGRSAIKPLREHRLQAGDDVRVR